MENHTNSTINITGDIMHNLAYEYKTTIREVNTIAGDEIFNTVSRVDKILHNNNK